MRGYARACMFQWPGSTLIDAGKGGRGSGARMSCAKMRPTASARPVACGDRACASRRTVSWASGIDIILYKAAGVAGPAMLARWGMRC